MSESDFIDEIRRRYPVSLPHLTGKTRLGELANNKVNAAAVWATLEALLPGAPRELLDSIESVEDAYGWYLERGSGADSGSPPPLRKVRLRPIVDSDLSTLYMTAASYEWGYRWRFRGTTPSFDQFMMQLFDDVLAQFIVEDIETGQPHGLVCSYNARHDLQTVFIAFMRISPPSGGGQMMEGVVLLIEHLFKHWPFRKIYAEVPEYNVATMFDVDSKAVRVEGRLKEHWYYNGQWWDQLMLALWREDWTADTTLRPYVASETS